MPVTAGKLRSWHRRAVAIETAARRLMDDMGKTLGLEGESTDPIDNVLHAIEELCDVLSRPELDIWKAGVNQQERKDP